MFEDFLSALDNLGLAFIELNDMIEWLNKFGFDIGVKPSGKDVSDVINKKMQIGPEEYQIDPEKDYYRGVPTILNSEVAALTKAM